MREQPGRIIHIAAENAFVPGCTISKQVYQDGKYGVMYFSLAPGTEISPESYSYPKLVMVSGGAMEVFDTDGHVWQMAEKDTVLLPMNIPVGMRTEEGCIYIEINMEKEKKMNELIKAGEVFQLGALLPYQEGKIVNMDIYHDDKMKFALMSFDAGTGLSEHAAPGEALVFALDGEGVIGYEGKDYPIKAGETFKFDKNGKHSVTANKQFKMALLLIFE